jgi:sec-independent protein translocase protein TatA
MFGIGTQELIIIFGIVFIIFGAKRLPELGKGLGQSIRGFKNAMEARPQIESSHDKKGGGISEEGPVSKIESGNQ